MSTEPEATEVSQPGAEPEQPAPAEQTETGAYVDLIAETTVYMQWACVNASCKRTLKSADQDLGKKIAAGETVRIACPDCKHEFPIRKKPERRVMTIDEAQRKPGYRPALSAAANRILRR